MVASLTRADAQPSVAIRIRRGYGDVLESPLGMKVRYIPRAQDDVDEIYEGIAANNPNRAQRVEHAIRAAADLLGRKPGLGAATGHEDARRWPMPEYAYAIFYRIDWEGEAIGILRVIDRRRVRNLKRVPRWL